jgi:hypothetical protein
MHYYLGRHGALVERKTRFTLRLHACVKKERARVCQMWLRTGSDRSRRTLLYVKSCLRRAQPQMACYRTSAAVFAGVGVQR